MNLLHQIVVAVLAVICFMGMAVQGAPSEYCSTCGGGNGGGGNGGPNLDQNGLNLNVLNAFG